MRLSSVHLENYRCHVSLKMDLRPGFNVIVGVNGSGKTSVLKAICDVLTGFTGWVSLPFANYSTLAEPNVARLKGEVVQGRYRFEPQFPVKVTAVAQAFDHSRVCTWTVEKSSQVNHAHQSGISPGQIWQEQHQAVASGAFESALPVIAFYRTSRHWSQPQPTEMQAATSRNARTDGYASWWDASLDSSALQGWVIGKCLERLQILSESGEAFDDIESDELALVNLALGTAIDGARGLRYDIRQKSLLVEWTTAPGEKERPPTAFENLSDGQRAVIGLVADIARRMCILNPQLGPDVTAKTSGVVLIDELDMHLHPRWQRILTSGLKQAFPEVQFIVASHSPQVLGELQPEEIILLRTNSTAHPQVSYGLTSSQVLEEIMGADARSPAVQQMLDEAFESLERGELEVAREKLDDLETAASGIPELAGAWALLRRKEVIGR